MESQVNFRLFLLLLVSLLLAACAPESPRRDVMVDGTYEGLGEGRGGIIKLSADVIEHRIAAARVLVQSSDLASMALKTGMDEAALSRSIHRYNGFQSCWNDADFHRSSVQMPVPLSKAPYYAVEVKPAIHHTMGGIHIDSKARVLDKQGRPVEGLFACGEVTGCVHGGNRLGGNGVADIVVFGRIAGREASLCAIRE